MAWELQVCTSDRLSLSEIVWDRPMGQVSEPPLRMLATQSEMLSEIA